jgi:hypothetical protein
VLLSGARLFDKAELEAKSAKELARLAAARIIYTAVAVAAHAKAVGRQVCPPATRQELLYQASTYISTARLGYHTSNGEQFLPAHA